MKYCLFLLATIGSAQTVSFGVKGGVPFEDQARFDDESRPYIVGPSIEVHLFGNFFVEADALYQRIGNELVSFSIAPGSNTTAGSTTFSTTRNRGNSWEFPVLAKYYFRSSTSAWRHSWAPDMHSGP
jgi:hypothetical protein